MIDWVTMQESENRNAATATGAEPSTVALDAAALRAGLLAHQDRLADRDAGPGRYRYAEGCPPTLWASAFFALVRLLIDEVDTLPEDERRGWAAYLADAQDEATGLWIDPAFRSADRRSEQHTDELLHWHSSTFIAGAIRALGGEVKHPVRVVHRLRSPAAMRQWLEHELPWEVSAWVVGNWTYDLGCLMQIDREVTGDGDHLAAMDAFFDWMDEHQLADTGWWDLKGDADVNAQQYGGYHTLMVYWMYDRTPPRPDAMIDSSLSLQTADGHFGAGGGCCPDMDVIDATVTLSRQFDTRRREVAAAMERALPGQLERWHPDGGFRDHDHAHGRNEFGWSLCRAAPGEPDPCSDLFRTFNLALITEVLDGTGFDAMRWRHHHLPCHGVRPSMLLPREATRAADA